MFASASPATTPLAAGLPWLLRLRLAALFGMGAVLAAAWFTLGLRVPLPPVLGLFAMALISLFSLAKWQRERTAAASALVVDTLLLTALLAMTGGPSNPFTVFYLVPVVLAALLLGGAWSWAMVALCAACFGALFPWHWPLEMNGQPAPCCQAEATGGLSFHLYGMWVAFVVVAACVAGFVNRMNAAMSAREAQLHAARAQSERFASLAALAAGAAHEIATPLATIAVAAKEMLRGAEGGIKEDAQLIRDEVDRCRRILDGMNPQAAPNAGSCRLDETLAQVRARFGPAVTVTGDGANGEIPLDAASLERMLGNLVKNALDASPAGMPVRVEAQVQAKRVRIRVTDAGPGMDAATLARAGEPFFTTKEPGAGMGLGLFVTRLLAQSIGGTLTLTPNPGQGLCAELDLPLEDRA